MEKYGIYSYRFENAPVEVDWTQPDGPSAALDSSDDHRREWLDHLFGPAKSMFNIKKQNKHDADTLPCTVLAHPERFVLLRLENPKKEHIYKKKENTPPGEVPAIVSDDVPSFPYLYVIFDMRAGVGRKVAISIASDAWRNLDTVARLIEENVNRHLRSLSCGFAIRIRPETVSVDFVSHSRQLIKKKKLAVKKVTFYLTRGLINPKIEEIIKSDPFLKNLEKRMLEAQKAEVTLYDPDSRAILKNKAEVLRHFAMLIASEPQADLFRLKIGYSDGSTYSCGKDIRMEFDMDDVTFSGLLGHCTLFPENEIGNWFDRKTIEIEQQRHEAATHPRRTPATESSLCSA